MKQACLVAVSIAALVTAPAQAAAATPHYTSVSAATAGPELDVSFVERGLVPGQNYAYTGSAQRAAERFQCYWSNSFTPANKGYTLQTTTTVGSPFGYTANANGVVRGHFLIDPVLPPTPTRDRCNRHQEAVPVHISFTNYEVVNINSFDYEDVAGTVSGPIEPD
jgi:opacity protein-like surface antigen